MFSRFFIPLLLLCVGLVSVLHADDGAHPAEIIAHQSVEAGDWTAARKAFTEAAEAGSPTAMAWLGWMHEQGRGVEANAALAAIWYTRAVEAGADHLAIKLGWLYLGGDASIRDRALAERWFLYAIEGGELDAHVALASLLIADALGGQHTERVHEAREWLLTAHQGGHPVAKFFLTRLYLEGIGGHPLDYQQAYLYASLGANEGHAQMQGWLAQIYQQGLGRQVDAIEAAKWASLAAVGGDRLGREILTLLEGELDAAQLAAARQRALEWASQ